jgi:hypothetical protein
MIGAELPDLSLPIEVLANPTGAVFPGENTEAQRLKWGIAQICY